MSKGGVKDVLDPKDVNAYGFYKLRGIKKVLFELAQILPKNIISFKIALILRKITLRNKVKIIDQTQFDLKLRLFPMDNLGDRFLLFLPKFFEYDEFQLMSQCLKEDSIFIDIGGNMGVYSLISAKYINKTGRILSFEPNPKMIERFRFNIKINEFDQFIELNEITDKEMTFSSALSKKNLGGASIVKSFGEDNVMVKYRTLLGLLNENEITKIDIEEAGPFFKSFFSKRPKGIIP
jgi:FkbM family methyltransferase